MDLNEQNRQDALKWAEVQLDEHKNCGCVLCRQAHALLDLDRQCRELEQSLHEARHFVDAADDECRERDEELRCISLDRDSWRKAAREHNIERIKAQSAEVRLRAALEQAPARTGLPESLL